MTLTVFPWKNKGEAGAQELNALALQALEARLGAYIDTKAPSTPLVGTTSANLTALGESAGITDKASKYNTAIGTFALAKNEYSRNNVALGYNALGNSNETQARAEAGWGGGNIAIGPDALEQLKPGIGALLVTEAAKKENSEENIAIGQGCAKKLTVGSGNIAMGHGAFEESELGYFNTIIGTSAGENLATGNKNVAIGHLAMQMKGGGGAVEKTAKENVAIGAESMEKAEKAKANVAVGHKSGGSLTNGEANVIIGDFAGSSLTTGGFNTIVGRNAGLNLISGGGNIFLGNRAGQAETGSNQLYIGTSEAAPSLIRGELPNAKLEFNATSIGFFKQAAATRPEVTGATVTAKQLAEALQTVGLVKVN